MTPLPSRRWIVAMTIGFLYAATVLRSVLTFDDRQRLLALTLFALWLALILTERAVSRRRPAWFAVCLALETLCVSAGSPGR